jgi:hypothetical protein
MDHKALSALILRLAGLLVIVYTVTNVAKSFGPFFDPTTMRGVGVWQVLVAALLSVGLPILIGLLLVYFPSTIATSVLKVQGGEVSAEDVRPLQRVAFSTLGLWLTLYSVIDAVYFWGRARLYFQYIEDMPAYGNAPALTPGEFGGLLSCAVQLVIGVCLLLGSRGLVNLLARIRA